MGKTTGFLEHTRELPQRRPVVERSHQRRPLPVQRKQVAPGGLRAPHEQFERVRRALRCAVTAGERRRQSLQLFRHRVPTAGRWAIAPANEAGAASLVHERRASRGQSRVVPAVEVLRT